MTSMERMDAVLHGRPADRPPFSFWYHFPSHQIADVAGAEAHLSLLADYQLDFLKVMNDNPYPAPGPIHDTGDLQLLAPLLGEEGAWAGQLKMLRLLKTQLAGKTLMTTTLFNAWATLRALIQPPSGFAPPIMSADDPPSLWILQAYDREPLRVHRALHRIAASLARFASRCISAGADGIFLSVRDDWVEQAGHKGLYRELVAPLDEEILHAAAGAPLNILHVCGQPVDFPFFANFANRNPVAALSWADRAAGPSIADAAPMLRPALCAGLDNNRTLPQGTPQQVQWEVTDAIRQAGNHPLIIAPGCTFDPHKVPAQNLHVIRAVLRHEQQPRHALHR